MNPCTGHPEHKGCAHPVMQKGMHMPYCIDHSCEGCLMTTPMVEPVQGLNLSIFRKDR